MAHRIAQLPEPFEGRIFDDGFGEGLSHLQGCVLTLANIHRWDQPV